MHFRANNTDKYCNKRINVYIVAYLERNLASLVIDKRKTMMRKGHDFCATA
jgi:hypothetical protein